MTRISRFSAILAATAVLAAAAVLLMVVGMNRGAPSGDLAHAADPGASRRRYANAGTNCPGGDSNARAKSDARAERNANTDAPTTYWRQHRRSADRR